MKDNVPCLEVVASLKLNGYRLRFILGFDHSSRRRLVMVMVLMGLVMIL
jgi:hypothetical protein